MIQAVIDGPVPLRAFFESLPLGLMVTDADHRIVFCNRAQLERDGVESAEVLGRSVFAVYPEEEWPAVLAARADENSPCSWSGSCSSNGRPRAVSITRVPLSAAESGVGAIYMIEDQVKAAAAGEGKRRQPPKEAEGEGAFQKLIGRSPGFRKAAALGENAASSPSPVLLAGETGTGKEMFARALHERSPRAHRNFVAINCSAIPQELLEGLLFGTARGAFTGATEKPGLFEEANQGTLFLDELDSMPLKLQPKLLRVLQDRKIRRVGSARELALDIKIISAISGPPEDVLESGRLRADLFYRLGVMIIKLPPLRERPEDLPLLVEHFSRKYNALLGRRVRFFSPEVMDAFQAYTWPGNVRELEHIIEAVFNVAGDEECVTLAMLPDHFSLSPKITLGGFAPESREGKFDFPPVGIDDHGGRYDLETLKDREKSMISQALFRAGGNVAQAARMLDISRQLLVYKMKKHQLRREHFKK